MNALTIHPKVAGGTLSGALGLIIVWLFSLGHIDVPPEVSGAMVLVLMFAGGWLTPSPAAETNAPPA
jgi:hypothetical protein